MTRETNLRSARKPDCVAIIRLVSIASGGVADYTWTRLARPGEDIFDAARLRYEREGTQSSCQNCAVATVDEKIVGMFLAWPEIAGVEAGLETDPVLAPLVNLREVESFYIDCVAVFENYRNQGIGSELLQLAERRADEKGLGKTSLIVFEDNSNAKRLYHRPGYREVSRVTTVPHHLIRHTGDAVLMVKLL